MKKEEKNNKQISPQEQADNDKVRKTAEQDIAKDPELSIHSKNDDLDEGELARLGGDKNDLA